MLGLIEHGFHTHPATRQALSDPDIRQQLAEDEVDAMAEYYLIGRVYEKNTKSNVTAYARG